MNVISPAKAAPSIPKSSGAVKVREHQMRAYFRDLERVQSIMWGLSANMRHLVEEAAEDKETLGGEAEALANNAEWLIDTLVDGAHELKRSLEEAGAAS